jgi:hypothetical protein
MSILLSGSIKVWSIATIATFVVGGMIGVFPLYLVTWVAAQLIHVPVAIRICVKNGICSACGYSIKGLEPQDDGCTVCPECGAAWRFEDTDSKH